ncbi:uncharacterized protein LOC124198727 isoform X3 [Daphnia pulex]|uniref:uncharacterized protein LOC124198727 isoform X3 n=1 Tax=Daphnia pulex TaxID=6669 RepID=UPI001EDD6017|nr:uncharacterized protein LOC124198727 isoform X3 [Daphnia pulex]
MHTKNGNVEKTCSLSYEDEEFVSCQICFHNFDENERIPKHLGKCLHFFCILCIKNLAVRNGKEILCPVCRSPSVLSPGNCEELITNHVALRLLKVVKEAQTKAETELKIQKWCCECSSPASSLCLKTQHQVQAFKEFYNAQSSLLMSIVNETNSAVDSTLDNCRKIQSAHKVILEWIKWLQLEISRRDVSNSATITLMESLKSAEVSPIPREEDMRATINHINKLIGLSSERSEEVCGSQFRTRDLVQAYGSNVLAFLVSFMNDEEQRKASSPGFAFVFNGNSGETLEPSNIPDNLMEVSIEIFEDEKPTEPRPSCSTTLHLSKRSNEDPQSNDFAFKRSRELPNKKQKVNTTQQPNGGRIVHPIGGNMQDIELLLSTLKSPTYHRETDMEIVALCMHDIELGLMQTFFEKTYEGLPELEQQWNEIKNQQSLTNRQFSSAGSLLYSAMAQILCDNSHFRESFVVRVSTALQQCQNDEAILEDEREKIHNQENRPGPSRVTKKESPKTLQVRNKLRKGHQAMSTRSSAINIKKTDPLPSSSSDASFESRFPGVTLTGHKSREWRHKVSDIQRSERQNDPKECRYRDRLSYFRSAYLQYGRRKSF